MIAFFMKHAIIVSAVFMLVICALISGCTSQTKVEVTPSETPPPASTPGISTAVLTVVSTPVAVETLPAEQFVDLALTKQRPDSTIHLLYNGGKGEVFVQNILMKVTRSDGQVIQQYMNDGTRKPRRGDELVIEGTRGTDQVQVFLTSAGRTYKIIDEPLWLTYL
jgi:hypothetical protein